MADENQTNHSALDVGKRLLQSSYVFYLVEGYKYTIRIGKGATTTAVSILKSADPGPLRQNWLFRFDNAHKGVNFPHLNIRHKYTGIADPHLKLPSGSLTVAKYSGYFAKFMNYAQYFAIAYDTARLGLAIKKDLRDGTIENSVSTGSDITLTWLGGIGGAMVGGSVGTFIFPGVGTLIGSLAIGTTGVFYGKVLAANVVNEWKKQQINNN